MRVVGASEASPSYARIHPSHLYVTCAAMRRIRIDPVDAAIERTITEIAKIRWYSLGAESRSEFSNSIESARCN